MQHGTQMPEETDGLRRSLLLSFAGATTLLWHADDLVLLGVIVTLVTLGMLTQRTNTEGLDQAMAGMTGGTIGGFLGAGASLVLIATWQRVAPPSSMPIMTASMAGMIGGALGGSWRLMCAQRRLPSARRRRIG